MVVGHGCLPVLGCGAGRGCRVYAGQAAAEAPVTRANSVATVGRVVQTSCREPTGRCCPCRPACAPWPTCPASGCAGWPAPDGRDRPVRWVAVVRARGPHAVPRGRRAAALDRDAAAGRRRRPAGGVRRPAGATPTWRRSGSGSGSPTTGARRRSWRRPSGAASPLLEVPEATAVHRGQQGGLGAARRRGVRGDHARLRGAARPDPGRARRATAAAAVAARLARHVGGWVLVLDPAGQVLHAAPPATDGRAPAAPRRWRRSWRRCVAVGCSRPSSRRRRATARSACTRWGPAVGCAGSSPSAPRPPLGPHRRSRWSRSRCRCCPSPPSRTAPPAPPAEPRSAPRPCACCSPGPTAVACRWSSSGWGWLAEGPLRVLVGGRVGGRSARPPSGRWSPRRQDAPSRAVAEVGDELRRRASRTRPAAVGDVDARAGRRAQRRQPRRPGRTSWAEPAARPGQALAAPRGPWPAWYGQLGRRRPARPPLDPDAAARAGSDAARAAGRAQGGPGRVACGPGCRGTASGTPPRPTSACTGTPCATGCAGSRSCSAAPGRPGPAGRAVARAAGPRAGRRGALTAVRSGPGAYNASTPRPRPTLGDMTDVRPVLPRRPPGHRLPTHARRRHPYDGSLVATVSVPDAGPGRGGRRRRPRRAPRRRHGCPSRERADALMHVSPPARRARRGDRPPDHRRERQADHVGARPRRPARRRSSAGPPRRPAARAASCMRLDTEPAAAGRAGDRPPLPAADPCSAIAPFNFPLNLVAHKVAPAIAVGAPVVIKPAPATPLSALLLGELLAETDLPAGMWSVLPVPNDGDAGAGAGPAAAGRVVHRLRRRSAASIRDAVPRKHVTLELGGNAAAVVCADWSSDADLDWAAAPDRDVRELPGRPVLHLGAAGARRPRRARPAARARSSPQVGRSGHRRPVRRGDRRRAAGRRGRRAPGRGLGRRGRRRRRQGARRRDRDGAAYAPDRAGRRPGRRAGARPRRSSARC